jgi:hypothetical protein
VLYLVGGYELRKLGEEEEPASPFASDFKQCVSGVLEEEEEVGPLLT